MSDAARISAIREFNRFYTIRLGLLRKRHLDGEFSLTEARMLYEIWSNPRLTASNLRGILGLDAGYISRLLASLTKRKLVRQAVSKADSRERLLSLTPVGEKKAAALNRQSEQQIQEILQGLSEEERDRLSGSLSVARSLLTVQKTSEVHVERLSEASDEVLDLLQEYYEAIGVMVRDTPESVREIVDDPDAGVWIATLNGKMVGCAYLHSLPSMSGATECKRLYVRPSARGKGVAHALLDAQEAFAKSRGFTRIYLDSKDDLRVAISLYQRRGFVACERYNDNPQATVFLMKELEEMPKKTAGKQRAR